MFSNAKEHIRSYPNLSFALNNDTARRKVYHLNFNIFVTFYKDTGCYGIHDHSTLADVHAKEFINIKYDPYTKKMMVGLYHTGIPIYSVREDHFNTTMGEDEAFQLSLVDSVFGITKEEIDILVHFFHNMKIER